MTLIARPWLMSYLLNPADFTARPWLTKNWAPCESENSCCRAPGGRSPKTETGLTIRAERARVSAKKDLEVRAAPRSLCITGKRQESSDQKEGNGPIYFRTATPNTSSEW